jgi:integrase
VEEDRGPSGRRRVEPRANWQPLDYVRDERLHALWWLVALRGLRRGEAVSLPWDNVDLDRGQLTISQQLTADAGTFAVSAPKSRASHRVIALDEHTVQVLREHARRQRLD